MSGAVSSGARRPPGRVETLAVVGGAAVLMMLAVTWHRPPAEPLPDFRQWPAGETRKVRFFEFLRPLLEAENARVLAARARLERIASTLPESGPGWRDRRWLAGLARHYRLDPETLTLHTLVAELLLRVDAVPVSLGLAQAAKESGWGTSRFAVEGHALFGERCFAVGCGVVPAAREDGLRHEVEAFPSPAAAVASYVHNLNTHGDYAALRRLRAELRAAGEGVTGFALADALDSYSERGRAYIREVRQLIRYNELGPAPGASP